MVMKKREIPFGMKYLHECFDCDLEKGELVWRHRPLYHFQTRGSYSSFNSKFAGNVAGFLHKGSRGDDYFKVGLTYKGQCYGYFVHTLVWMFYNDEVTPSDVVIDHIDGDSLNNGVENLRAVPIYINLRNSKRYRNNKTGFCGVSYSKDTGKYMARAYAENGDGKTTRVYLGLYSTAEAANDALVEYRAKHGYTERHGM